MAAEKKAAATPKEVVGKSGACYSVVPAPDCGEQFVALVKRVPRTGGDKVKRLVFNRDDQESVRQALK